VARNTLQNRMEILHDRLEKANLKHRRRVLAISDDYQTKLNAERARHAAEVSKIRERLRD